MFHYYLIQFFSVWKKPKAIQQICSDFWFNSFSVTNLNNLIKILSVWKNLKAFQQTCNDFWFNLKKHKKLIKFFSVWKIFPTCSWRGSGFRTNAASTWSRWTATTRSKKIQKKFKKKIQKKNQKKNSKKKNSKKKIKKKKIKKKIL